MDAAAQGRLVRKLEAQYGGNYGANSAGQSKKYKIRFYETNKIRKLLANYYNVGGYPVKFNHYVSYFSGVAIWLPNQWIIEPKSTRDNWRGYHLKTGISRKQEIKVPLDSIHTEWTSVVIWKIDIYDDFKEGIMAMMGKSDLGSIPFIGKTD